MKNNTLTRRFSSTIVIMGAAAVLFWLGCASGINPPDGWDGGDSVTIPILTISGSIITPTSASIVGADASVVADISGATYDATLTLNGEVVGSCTVANSILDCPFYELNEVPADGSELVLTVTPSGGTEPLIQGSFSFTMPEGISFDAGTFDMDSTLAYWSLQYEPVQAHIASLSQSAGKAMSATAAALAERFETAITFGTGDLSEAEDAATTALALMYAWRVAYVANFGEGLGEAIEGYLPVVAPYLLVIANNADSLSDDDLLFSVLGLNSDAVQSSLFDTLMAMDYTGDRGQMLLGAFAFVDFLSDLQLLGNGDTYDEIYQLMLAQDGGDQLTNAILGCMGDGSVTEACVSGTMRPSGVVSANGWQNCRNHMKIYGFSLMTTATEATPSAATLRAMNQAIGCSITAFPGGIVDYFYQTFSHSGGVSGFIGDILSGTDPTGGIVDLEDSETWMNCLVQCGQTLGIDVLNGTVEETSSCLIPTFGPTFVDAQMTPVLINAFGGNPTAFLGEFENSSGDDDDGDDDDDETNDDAIWTLSTLEGTLCTALEAAGYTEGITVTSTQGLEGDDFILFTKDGSAIFTGDSVGAQGGIEMIGGYSQPWDSDEEARVHHLVADENVLCNFHILYDGETPIIHFSCDIPQYCRLNFVLSSGTSPVEPDGDDDDDDDGGEDECTEDSICGAMTAQGGEVFGGFCMACTWPADGTTLGCLVDVCNLAPPEQAAPCVGWINETCGG